MDGVGRRFWGWGAFGAVMALRLAVISAETSLGLAYLRQTEFIILNNGAVSGFFAQKFLSVQRLKRVTAPSCGMIGRIRRASPVMGWSVSELQRASPLMGQHASACRPPPTAHRPPPTACAPPPVPGPRLRRRPAGSGRLRSACCRWSSRHPPGPGAGRPPGRGPAH